MANIFYSFGQHWYELIQNDTYIYKQDKHSSVYKKYELTIPDYTTVIQHVFTPNHIIFMNIWLCFQYVWLNLTYSAYGTFFNFDEFMDPQNGTCDIQIWILEPPCGCGAQLPVVKNCMTDIGSPLFYMSHDETYTRHMRYFEMLRIWASPFPNVIPGTPARAPRPKRPERPERPERFVMWSPGHPVSTMDIMDIFATSAWTNGSPKFSANSATVNRLNRHCVSVFRVLLRPMVDAHIAVPGQKVNGSFGDVSHGYPMNYPTTGGKSGNATGARCRRTQRGGSKYVAPGGGLGWVLAIFGLVFGFWAWWCVLCQLWDSDFPSVVAYNLLQPHHCWP